MDLGLVEAGDGRFIPGSATRWAAESQKLAMRGIKSLISTHEPPILEAIGAGTA